MQPNTGTGKKRTNSQGGTKGRASEPLSDRAYQGIKKMFLAGELIPGQKLRYQDIAQRLEVSQTPVIQALTRLENEGLVMSEANKGFFVPELDLDEARELYEIREVLEIFLIERAARRISEKQLTRLREIMAEHNSVRGAIYCRERLWLDAKFHRAIADFSGHRQGATYLRQIFDRLVLRYRPEHLTPERMIEADEQHRDIYDALAARDDEAAVKIVRGHIQAGMKHILAGLRRDLRIRRSVEYWE